jgi:hypothetical protein
MTVWEGPANIQALEILRLVAGRHGADKIFAARIEAMLAAASSSLGSFVTILRAGLKDWQEALALVRADPAEARRHARRLMALMADILAASLLLVEAEEGLKLGDHRKPLIARLFIEARFQPPARRGILPQRDWVYREFDALATCQPIAKAP